MFKFNFQLLKMDLKKKAIPFSFAVIFIVVCNYILGKVCYFRAFTGLPCPGCGITRAFLLAFQLKFVEATMMHPFWIILVLLIINFVFFRYFVVDKEKSKKAMKILSKCAIVIVILCLAYYIYRMVTWFPYREPMIYDPDNIFSLLLKSQGK